MTLIFNLKVKLMQLGIQDHNATNAVVTMTHKLSATEEIFNTQRIRIIITTTTKVTEATTNLIKTSTIEIAPDLVIDREIVTIRPALVPIVLQTTTTLDPLLIIDQTVTLDSIETTDPSPPTDPIQTLETIHKTNLTTNVMNITKIIMKITIIAKTITTTIDPTIPNDEAVLHTLAVEI